MMEAHPMAEAYPLMEGEAFEALKADVAANGQRNPIWLFGGKILDGRNRYRACVELGIEPRCEEYTGDDPAGFVESMNDHRRHEDKETVRRRRAERVRALRAEGKSQREIAEAVGVSKRTVQNDLQGSKVDTAYPPDPDPPPPAPEPTPAADPEAEPEETLPPPPPPPAAPARVTGRDGKQYPARKPRKAAGREPARPALSEREKKLRGMALEAAEQAINALRGIGRDNPGRKDAFQVVFNFMKANP